MSDNKTKQKVLADKLNYLYKMELTQRKFQVLEIDIDFEEDQLENGEWILVRTVLQVDFEYDGRLDGDEPYLFSRDLKIMCDNFVVALSQYTPTQEYKIVGGSSESYVSEPMIIGIDYKYEETHTFRLATFITTKEYYNNM
jgi:hypothetical protein